MASSTLFSEEIIDRFLDLYRANSVADAISTLESEYPAVKRAHKDRKYWVQIATRRGVRKKKQSMPKENSVVDQLALPDIRPSTPDVPLPENIIFGGHALPVEAIQQYRKLISEGRSKAAAHTHLQEQFPALQKLPPTSIANFLNLRLGLSTVESIIEVTPDKFAQLLAVQHRNQLVMDLYKQRWRESAIAEKAAELFPHVDPLAPEDIKSLVKHRRQRVAKSRRRNSTVTEKGGDAPPEKPQEIKKTTKHTVTVAGPDLYYTLDLSVDQAKSLMKTLLDY